MMDNRKRCDEGRGAFLRYWGGGGVDKIQAFRSFFVYFEGRAVRFWRQQ